MENLQGSTNRRSQLDQWMDQRRQELRLRWAQVAELAGMTTPNLLRIRKGQISISWGAADRIEDALHWERGSVEAAVLMGIKPQPRTSPSDEPSPRSQQLATESRLTEEDKMRFEVLKGTIRAEDLTNELRWALLVHILTAMGIEPTEAAVDAWLNSPDRLEAIRAAQNRKETDQVTTRDQS